MNVYTIENEEPESPETTCIVMHRKEFNAFLHRVHGYELGDHRWKAAQIELKNGEIDSPRFDRIEFFTDTLVGPIVAQRYAKTEEVFVTIQRQRIGDYDTSKDIIAALENGDLPLHDTRRDTTKHDTTNSPTAATAGSVVSDMMEERAG